MKKILFVLLGLILVGNGCLKAEEYRKPVVLVNYFKRAGNVEKHEVEKLRTSIIASITNYDRLNVVDIALESSLSEETKRRMREESIYDELAASGEMLQLGANFILECSATDVVVSRKERKYKDKTETYYEAVLNYTVNIISTEDGTTIYSQNYESKETADTNSEARSETFERGISCGALIEMAPLVGDVVDTDYTLNKKGKKMETCYIKLGKIHGVKNGSYFNIDKVKYVAGEATYERVGKLKVISVHNKISQCEVFSNKEEVLVAMKEYLKMKTTNPDVAMPLRVRSRCDSGRLVTF